MKKTLNFRNIFLLLAASFLMLTFHAPLMAQKDDDTDHFCATPSDFSNTLAAQSNLYSCFENNCNVNVCFHIIRRSDNTGGLTDNELTIVKQLLHNDFSWLGIHFTFLETKILKSDFFFNANDIGQDPQSGGNFNSLTSQNVEPNAINIYLGPRENAGKGQAGAIPSKSIVLTGTKTWAGVENYYPITHAISHEMGHCLGLFHTFHGSRVEAVGCAEFINGTNGATCGDFVGDTPADGVRWRDVITTGCYYNNQTVKDPNNQLYSITPVTFENIMAYLPNQCMTVFTYGQANRMIQTIKTSPLLQNITSCQTVQGGGGSTTYLKTAVNNEMDISIFPNPTVDLISIQPHGFIKDVTIILTDIVGREVKRQMVDNINKTTPYSFDVSDVQKGTYLCTIKYGAHEIVKKIVKL